MQKQFREIIGDDELYACPIDEHIRVIDFNIALQILRMDVHNLDNSFLTTMHREMVNQMLQRRTMAKQVLFTPNFCAELFSKQEYLDNSRYIVNKLIGRFDYEGRWTEDMRPLEKQVYRKILKFDDPLNKGFYFFWDREPNLIMPDGELGWRFASDSPAYKSLLEFYAKFKLIKSV